MLRSRRFQLALPLLVIVLLWVIFTGSFAIINTPTGSPSPTPFPTSQPTNVPTLLTNTPTPPTPLTNAPTPSTNVPTLLTNAPTSSTNSPTSLTNAPTAIPTNAPSAAPTSIFNVSDCVCPPNALPLYNTFPHPLHTNASYIQLNFYNDRGVDRSGNNLTVWITISMTADERAQSEDPRFRNAFTYIYVDAQPVSRGQTFFYTIFYNLTAAGRMPGGRIFIYYRNPAEGFDLLRATRYGGHYPIQTDSPGTAITDSDGAPRTPSNLFQGLMEFSIDHDRLTDPLTKSFLGYDYSAVDSFALPMYGYGGYDPFAVNGTENNQLFCNKAYVACPTPQTIEEGCPTQIEQIETTGSTCISALSYCLRDPNVSSLVSNASHWQEVCHHFDTQAAIYGITQAKVDFFRSCIGAPLPRDPRCPSTDLNFFTPTAIIYACIGQFLLENHCLQDGSSFTNSTLSTDQCSALNRGVCFQPNGTSIPPVDGLSCSLFGCTGGNITETTSCFVPCFDYSCFGFHCTDFASRPAFNATCNALTCPVGGSNTNCINNTVRPTDHSVVSTCDSTFPNPYTYPNQTKNEYAAWVRSKGERLYAFSLDERGVVGGFQACRFSTQLDIVIYPGCNKTWTPPQ